MFSRSFSATRRIAFSHNSCAGKSNVSANRMGIEPAPNASQKRMELGPLPLGLRVYLEHSNNSLYFLVFSVYLASIFNSPFMFCFSENTMPAKCHVPVLRIYVCGRMFHLKNTVSNIRYIIIITHL